MTNRAQGEDRKASILNAGLEIWRAEGAGGVNARAIGSKLGLTHAGVLYHHGTAEKLKQAVAEYAVRINDLIVVPQLITSNHDAVAHLSPQDKQALLSTVTLHPPNG